MNDFQRFEIRAIPIRGNFATKRRAATIEDATDMLVGHESYRRIEVVDTQIGVTVIARGKDGVWIGFGADEANANVPGPDSTSDYERWLVKEVAR